MGEKTLVKAILEDPYFALTKQDSGQILDLLVDLIWIISDAWGRWITCGIALVPIFVIVVAIFVTVVYLWDNDLEKIY